MAVRLNCVSHYIWCRIAVPVHKPGSIGGEADPEFLVDCMGVDG